MPLSGASWVSQFPTSRKIEDLAQPFRDRVARFVAAMRAAGATVTIADTLRPPARAYLMHFAFEIAREGGDPASVPVRAGVDIQWVHPDAPETPGATASRIAAEQMVQGYGIAFKPALTSRHIEGNAIDMSISWNGNLVVARADGTRVTITSTPRDGGNTTLHQVGASYGVIKLATDPPHWSSDGH